MPKAESIEQARRLTDLPNIGRAMERDFALLGITAPRQLAGRDPVALYDALCERTGVRQDPCVLDTFMAAVDFANGGEARPWWAFTAHRKATWKEKR